jgi:hypothetical protein
MPLSDWRKAFGFLVQDNPFNPSQPLDGMANADLMLDLGAQALPIHREPKLGPLFCADAGGFAQSLQKFHHRVGVAGYRPGPPPSVGTQPFLILIGGPKGSGKTTLANVMVEWVSRCDPRGVHWDIYDPWSTRDFDTPESQIAALGPLEADIKDKQPVHCCVLLDNLLTGVETAALNLYAQLRVPPAVCSLYCSRANRS